MEQYIPKALEVNLEEEIKEEYLERRWYSGKNNMFVILNEPQFNEVAKHFFELGLSVSNKAQKGEKNMTRKGVENLKEWFKPIHDSGRRMFGSEAYDSHIKEVLKFFGYDTEDGVIKEIFDI